MTHQNKGYHNELAGILYAIASQLFEQNGHDVLQLMFAIMSLGCFCMMCINAYGSVKNKEDE